MDYRILAINPGSTSTKIAVYDDENMVFTETIRHNREDLGNNGEINNQLKMRETAVLNVLENHNIKLNSLSAVVGRGGILPPVKHGAYEVNDVMVKRLLTCPIGEHASNLAAPIALDIAREQNIKSYIYDSVSVDEFWPLARFTGIPELPRTSVSHVLNTRAVSIKQAELMGKKYEDISFVVAHMGGGTTLSLHYKGKIVDILDNDEGPFSPEAAGRIPTKRLISMVKSGKYSMDFISQRLRGTGGMIAHLGTADGVEIVNRINSGDEQAKLVLETMAYQVAKGIGELSAAAKGDVDGIILTGGLAYIDMFTAWIKERVSFIAPVYIQPGEMEMEALAKGCLRVLRGEEVAMEYKDTI